MTVALISLRSAPKPFKLFLLVVMKLQVLSTVSAAVSGKELGLGSNSEELPFKHNSKFAFNS